VAIADPDLLTDATPVRTIKLMRRLLSFTVLLALTMPAVSSSQGLAAVAKKEEERRKATEAGKVYTNNDLKADTPSTPSPAPAANASPAGPNAPSGASTQAPSENPPGGAAAPATEVKDEAYWRSRISAARSALERSRIFADALQSRLNALSTDIVNRDDPAQRSQLELERQRAVAELARVNREIAESTKTIAGIEEEARKAGVPPGWLR
jgi:hypothetical protein